MGNFVVTRSFVYANCTHVHRREQLTWLACVFILDLIDEKEEEVRLSIKFLEKVCHWRPLSISHFNPHRHDCQLKQDRVNNSSHPFRFVRGKKRIRLTQTEETKNLKFSYHIMDNNNNYENRLSFSCRLLLLSPSTSVNNKPFQFLSALVVIV